MKNLKINFKKILFIAFFISVLIGSCKIKPQKIGLWDIFEYTLVNNKTYSNPFKDVSLTAIYTGPDGKKAELQGFYAGENQWKI
ncbi:MAG: DUF5060 domain-containing protein, partial [Bacteroidales bacterium]|nr:DUF5060 domain-containing protein [Bacteroidales bacterium]